MVRAGIIVAVLLVATVALGQTLLGPGAYSFPPGTVVTGGMEAGGTLTVPDPPPPPPTYANRCEELRAVLGAGLVNCWSFERPEDALLQEAGRQGAEYRPAVTIDATMAASGASSLKFETISYHEAKARCPGCSEFDNLRTAQMSNSSWWGRNFSPDLDVQFGLGEEFWLQYRKRENDAFYTPNWGGAGPKKHILGAGDRWVDFVSQLREPLPASAKAGAFVYLGLGDGVAAMPNFGTLTVGTETITYFGRDVAANAVKINARDPKKAVDHAIGEPTSMRHLQYAPGCSDLELPVTSSWRYIPASYHSCGVKDKSYEGHDLPVKNEAGTFNVDYIMQSGRRGTWNETTKTWDGACSLNKIKTGDYSGCLVDRPGEGWTTWTIHVKVAQPAWYRNDKVYTHASSYRVWRNDQLMTELSPDLQHPRLGTLTPEQCRAMPLAVVDATRCLTGYDFVRGAVTGFSLTGPMSQSDPGGKWGKIWLNMQSWNRQVLPATDPLLCCHPIVVSWYDDLVVSRVPIPLPDGTVLGGN